MIEKVKSKEELIFELKNNKSIISNELYEYLNSLIELEFSALKNCITNEERKFLFDFGLYKQIVVYNIYERALNILSRFDCVLKKESELDLDNLNAYVDDKKVFEFKYNRLPISEMDKICLIELHNMVKSDIQREKELSRIINKLETLYKENNPFGSSKTYALQAYNWAFTHKNMIEQYENMLIEIDSKKVISDLDKRNMEIVNEINKLFMDDYGIAFSELNEKQDMTSSLMNREYTKTINDVSFKNKIKYI